MATAQKVHVASTIAKVLQSRAGDIPVEDSFFIIDPSALKDQVALWRDALPNVVPHYAVKCNNHPEIVSRLIKWGINFDCASKTEIALVLSLGAKPSQIIYANPVKAPTHLKFSSQNDVLRMTFDNIAELDKIKKIAPQSELLLRIKTDDSGAVCSLSCKFGASMQSVDSLLEHAKKLGLNVIGVAYHVGSGGGAGPQAHAVALKDARGVFETALTRYGYKLQVLDVGGGFEASADDFLPVAREINRSLEELDFPADITIMGEPGRFFAAPTMTLVANVIGLRAAPSTEEVDMVYLTDGVYGNLNSIIYDHQQPRSFLVESSLSPDSNNEYEPPHQTSLWGPTCDGLDSIDSNSSFSRRLRVGDWIYFPDSGAYTLVGESEFNGFNTNTHFYVAE